MEKVVIPFRMVMEMVLMMLMIVRIICILTMVTRCMDINIMAAMEAAELVLDRMSLANGGKGGLLVNTASLAGFSILGQLLPILLLIKESYLGGFKTCTATLRPSTRW